MLRFGIRLLAVTALVLLAGAANAQTSFEELSGKFAIDLPDGYELQPQKYSILFQFWGPAGQIMMVLEEGGTDLAESYESALSNLDGTLKNPEPIAPVVTMTLNGSPAKWGVYKGTVESDGKTVPLYTYVGSMLIDDGSVYFLSFVSEGSHLTWGEKVTKSFYSLRNVDSPLTGARDVKPAG
ncbi:MAG: hypothetical protein OEY16_04720 [Alphaproteobacteria bacterium]|nr:hypothetical protein [Alphaproteobacteria bacterium]